MSKNETRPGVVVDRPTGNALLHMAITEHLVDDDPTIGDGFVRQLLDHPPSHELALTAREQLVLGGRIFVPFWLPPSWDGELFESGVIEGLPYIGEEDLVEVSDLPAEVILQMLHTRGQLWDLSALMERYEEYRLSYEAARTVLTQHQLNASEVYMKLAPAINPNLAFSVEQKTAAVRFRSASAALHPAIRCLDDYKSVLTHSISQGSLSALPIHICSSTQLITRPTEDIQERTQILYLACETLELSPTAATLRDTISLASAEASDEFRHRLDRWTQLLRSKPDKAMRKIDRIFKRARAANVVRRKMGKGGQLLTGVGVTSAIAGFFTANPIVTGAGVVATLGGGVLLAGDKAIKLRTKWASFGISH